MTLAVVALFVLYCLSIGPVVWLLEWSGIGPSNPANLGFFVFYYPVIWLAENVEIIHDFYLWYGELWGF